ncbi:hypothetical protein DB345_04205 [Spartobacteria bacterium LR76]|nr:hypothetical protein DB345_04205 [Spartobacteria bacterium LR76]
MVLAGLCAVICGVSASAGFAEQKEAPRNLSDFVLGFNAHSIQERDAPFLKAIGIHRLRLDLGWRYVSDEGGVVDPGHRGLQSIVDAPAWIDDPLVILGYGHPAFQNGGRPSTPEARRAYVAYALASAEKLHSKTKLFEVWNEWNVAGMGRTPMEEGVGKPEDYAALLAETYAALKARFPDLVVLGGAMGGIGADDDYLPRAIKAGMLRSLDGLSIHPYFYGAKDPLRLPEIAIPARMSQLAEWLQAAPGGADTPLYVTELGWPTYGEGFGVTPDEQADFMVRSVLLLACYRQVRGVWLYEFRDSGQAPGEREHHFGIVASDGTPKPAYHLLGEAASLLSQALSIERISNPSGDRVVTMRCAMKDGSEAWICWTTYPGETARVSLRSGRDASTWLEKNAGNRPVILRGSSGGLIVVGEKS